MEVEAASTTASQIAPTLPATTEFPSFTSTTNSKSRKFRRRPVEDDDGPAATAAPTTTTAAAAPSQPSQTTTTLTIPPAPPPRSPNVEGSEPTPSLAEILRLRKKIARTSALRGLEVSAPKHAPQTPAQDSGANDGSAAKMVVTEAELEAVVNRFTHQTGQILDVDRHMMAYIESEMSKRRGEWGGDGFGAGGGNTGARGVGGVGSGSGRTDQESTKSAYWTPVVPEGRGATLGKLHEVDLGEEAKKHNIARTKEATRRLQGGEEEIEDDPSTAPNTSTANNIPNRKKMKNRRRRNSQDVQRDKLVEEVLKESRLEMYTDPDPTEDQRESEGAADDRIAEKFRREFLDALMTRRRRRGGDGKKKRDENKKPRGPKLGGSRQARAAMRESQQNSAVGSGAGKKKK